MAPGVNTRLFLKNCEVLNRRFDKPLHHPLSKAIIYHIVYRQGPFLVWLHEPSLLAPTHLAYLSLEQYYERAATYFFFIGVAEMNQRLLAKSELLDDFATFLSTCWSPSEPILHLGSQPLAFTIATAKSTRLP